MEKEEMDSNNAKSDSHLKPLLFSTQCQSKPPSYFGSCTDPVLCPLCTSTFVLHPTSGPMLHHLLAVHKLVIADVKLVADLKSYLEYWRGRFQEQDLRQYCSVIKTNTRVEDQAPSESYYLLCDVLPEDKSLRERLQKDRLDYILEKQQEERTDQNFRRLCLFCEKIFTVSRADLFNHMAHDHNFSVGQPDNIVFGKELLDLLEEKLKKLQCLYCEKTFKDWQILKEHMRKKQHRKINPKNTQYDKFYVINYLEIGKNWETLQAEEETDDHIAEDASVSSNNTEWEDWTEDRVMGGAVCLFCEFCTVDSLALLQHMQEEHRFNLSTIKRKLNLNFYHQVKLINYIRKQVYQRHCIFCEAKFESREKLLLHMSDTGHVALLPDSSVWDQPQYFFPTYEDDQLLCTLDDEADDETDDKQVIIPEDTPRGDLEELERILTSD